VPIFSDPTVNEIFPPWKEWTDKVTKIFSYARTRREVRTGATPWDYSSDEIKSKKLLEPWPFNIYQSALSALPGVIAVATLSFLGIEVNEKLTFADPFDSQVNAHFEKILSYLQPFIIPLALAVACFGAAWASLERADRSKERMARARRAYLYYDGAYGLWAQAIMSFVLTFFYSPLREKLGLTMIIGLLLFFAAVTWQRTISGWKLPKALFTVNGYSYEYPKRWFWFRSDPVSRSWRQYRLVGMAASNLNCNTSSPDEVPGWKFAGATSKSSPKNVS
jgi:hypothetical protein